MSQDARGPDSSEGAKVQETVKDTETWMEKAVRMRVFFYIFGTHLFAGFVWLLFYLGDHAHK
ncbi:DUF6126 family protein [Streptomyces sp. NPDC058385]|uniref:DUF6126 family protein n=1 Tax=Streptomyces sp. NPDC058385 TaxID=3346473 RepID=UPI00365E291D